MIDFMDPILDLVRPLLKWIGDLHLPYTRKKITGEHYYEWRDLLTPGTILLSNTLGEISNFISPSDIKHGAIYVGGDKVKYVVEATKKGVQKKDLVSFMTSKDRLIIIMPLFSNPDLMDEAAEAAESLLAKEYDYHFKNGNDAYYCFELIIKAYQEAHPYNRFKNFFVIDRYVWTSDSFLSDPDNWRVLLDSKKELA